MRAPATASASWPSTPMDCRASRCDPHYELHRNRPKVGVWYWEVDKLPVSMRPAYELVDEVWCSTEYMRSSLARWTEGTVRKHPLIIDVPSVPPSITRTDLGLPEDKFLFGCIFDYASVLRRKNPTGVIQAYQAAFGPDDGAALVAQDDQRAAMARGDGAHPGRRRRSTRHPRHRRAHLRDRDAGVDRSPGLLRVAASERGPGVVAGRIDGRRRTGHRHRLLRQPRVHVTSRTPCSCPTS